MFDGDPLQAAAFMEAVAERADRDAFAQLFNYYAPRIKSFIRRQGASDTASEEVAQEVLLTVWRRAGAYDRSKAGVSTWIYTLARNKSIDLFRRENRPDLDPDDPSLAPTPEAPPGEHLDAAREALRVRDALKTLPEEQAVLLRMSFYEEKSHGVIAEETGIPLGTVKSRLRLAMAKLARTLEDVGRDRAGDDGTPP